MIGFLFFLFGLIVTLGMCGLAAASDFKGFRIPNHVSVVILAAFASAFTITEITGQGKGIFLPISSHLAAFGIVLLVTMVMYALRAIGAGDSKFAASVGIWLGLPGLAPFLFYMALIGGVLGVVSLILKKWKPLKHPPQGSWPAKAQEGHNAVPYGIAIAAGAAIAFCYVGYFDLNKWGAMFHN